MTPRRSLLLSAAWWSERAKWYRTFDLDAAHRCELRAAALLENPGYSPSLRGFGG
jgi:hypothetical protein